MHAKRQALLVRGLPYLVFVSILTSLVTAAEAQQVVWERQFAPTAGSIEATAVTTDPLGAAYVTGWTTGTLPGETSAGLQDGFVRKYDPDGVMLWTRQFGSSIPSTGGFDVSLGAAADITAVYLVGRTSGTFAGQTSAGGYDVFIRKYDLNGNEAWTRQLGSAASEWAAGVAVLGGDVYVAGTVGGVAWFRDQLDSDCYIDQWYSTGGHILRLPSPVRHNRSLCTGLLCRDLRNDGHDHNVTQYACRRI